MAYVYLISRESYIFLHLINCWRLGLKCASHSWIMLIVTTMRLLVHVIYLSKKGKGKKRRRKITTPNCWHMLLMCMAHYFKHLISTENQIKAIRMARPTHSLFIFIRHTCAFKRGEQEWIFLWTCVWTSWVSSSWPSSYRYAWIEHFH